jgi:hypothetical protein
MLLLQAGLPAPFTEMDACVHGEFPIALCGRLSFDCPQYGVVMSISLAISIAMGDCNRGKSGGGRPGRARWRAILLLTASLAATGYTARAQTLTSPALGHEPRTDLDPAEQRTIALIKSELADAFATGDDYTIVSAIREWAFRNFDRAGDADLQFDPYGLSFGQAVETMLADGGGAFCGGHSVVLARIYYALGYDVQALNLGDPSTSHMLTLVRIHHGGRDILSVQDSYFGYGLLMDGAPADALEVLAALGAGAHDRITFDIGQGGCKPYLAPAESVDSHRAYQAGMYEVSPLQSRSETHGTFCHNFRIDNYLSSGDGAAYVQWLEARGHPAEFAYMLLYPISASGGPAYEEAALAAQAAHAAQESREAKPETEEREDA